VGRGNESSWERKFHVTFAPGSESSRERKFQGAKVPYMELSFPGAKVRGNESSIILLIVLSLINFFAPELFLGLGLPWSFLMTEDRMSST